MQVRGVFGGGGIGDGKADGGCVCGGRGNRGCEMLWLHPTWDIRLGLHAPKMHVCSL
jgi:hypothetical protein